MFPSRSVTVRYGKSQWKSCLLEDSRCWMMFDDVCGCHTCSNGFTTANSTNLTEYPNEGVEDIPHIQVYHM